VALKAINIYKRTPLVGGLVSCMKLKLNWPCALDYQKERYHFGTTTTDTYPALGTRKNTGIDQCNQNPWHIPLKQWDPNCIVLEPWYAITSSAILLCFLFFFFCPHICSQKLVASHSTTTYNLFFSFFFFLSTCQEVL